MILIIGGYAQGKKEYADKHYGADRILIDDLNAYVRKSGMNSVENICLVVKEQLLEGGADVIITSEVGCGIVPLDKKDRDYRELIGRIQIELASYADEVIRVTCGIGQKIK